MNFDKMQELKEEMLDKEKPDPQEVAKVIRSLKQNTSIFLTNRIIYDFLTSTYNETFACKSLDGYRKLEAPKITSY